MATTRSIIVNGRAPDAVAHLERDPLRAIVLLKHLAAFPRDARLLHVQGAEGMACLVLLDAALSPYDRHAYPAAALVAMVASDHPAMTAPLMDAVPRGTGIVFKIASDADAAVVHAAFPVARTTSVLSFTARSPLAADDDVRATNAPHDAAFQLFAVQDHNRDWLEPKLTQGTATAFVLGQDGAVASACFVFENYGRIWEIGGVVTAPRFRRRGLAARVVRTAVAWLQTRGCIPRYQAQEDNLASIALARAIGLELVLTTTHLLHAPADAGLSGASS